VSLAIELSARSAETSTPIHPVLAGRWSPRSFDAEVPIDERKLTAALEAARWSPSAANSQPWRFIVARRGGSAFETIVGTMRGANGSWALSAGALIVGLAETSSADGAPRPWGRYDLGQALAHLSVQAHHDGLHVHQMGGFDAERIHTEFALEDRLEAVSVTAIGELASPDALPEALREREGAPRTRLPLGDIVVVND
jgi:nitroreductase